MSSWLTRRSPDRFGQVNPALASGNGVGPSGDELVSCLQGRKPLEHRHDPMKAPLSPRLVRPCRRALASVSDEGVASAGAIGASFAHPAVRLAVAGGWPLGPALLAEPPAPGLQSPLKA